MTAMTSSTGSPAPKPPRSRPNHRHSKSSSAIAPAPSVAPPRSRHAHQLQNPPPRGLAKMNSAPQAPQTPHSDNGSTKKKKRPRKQKDSAVKTPPAVPDSGAPLSPARFPVEEDLPSPPVDTPGKAYAGPTFHHSPAPGSLPVPKYFSKSVPAPRTVGLQAMMEEDDEYSSLSPSRSSPEEEDHLQKLFRADREEKARNKSYRSDDNSDSDSTPDSQKEMFFFSEPESPVRKLFNTPSTTSRPRLDKAVSDDLFTMDMDKKSVSPPSNSPSPPNRLDDVGLQAKLRQYLLQSPSPRVSPIPPTSQPYGYTQPSFSPAVAHSPIPQRYQKSQPRPVNTTSGLLSTPPPKAPQFRRPEYAQTTSQRPPLRPAQTMKQPFTSSTAWDVVDMENNLRKILKLDAIAPARPSVML